MPLSALGGRGDEQWALLPVRPEVPRAEAAKRLQQLLDDTTSKKAHNEQTKAHIYVRPQGLSGTDDLLCYPAAALADRWQCPPGTHRSKLKAKTEQKGRRRQGILRRPAMLRSWCCCYGVVVFVARAAPGLK